MFEQTLYTDRYMTVLWNTYSADKAIPWQDKLVPIRMVTLKMIIQINSDRKILENRFEIDRNHDAMITEIDARYWQWQCHTLQALWYNFIEGEQEDTCGLKIMNDWVHRMTDIQAVEK